MSKEVEVNGSYVNTAQNKNSAANGAQILSLVTPSCVVLRSVTVAAGLWGTILRCFRRLQSIVSMSKKIYENFVGTLETVRNRQQLSVLEWCRYRDFRLYKKRWISCIVRSGLNPALGAWRCCPKRMSRVKLFHTSDLLATLTPII